MNEFKRNMLKTVLYEPVAPYFSNIYNTLINIVQGISLGALFYILKIIVEQNSYNFLIVCKFSLTFLIICLVWHRYVTHIQYLAWRLGVFDTIIPMSFAPLQMFLVLSINKPIFWFSLGTSLIFVCGFVAYLNGVNRHDDDPEIVNLYREHFSCVEDTEFVEIFLSVLKDFLKKAEMTFFTLACVFGLLTFFIYRTTYDTQIWKFDERLCSIITIVFFGLALIWLFHYDLRNELNKFEKLKKYGFKW